MNSKLFLSLLLALPLSVAAQAQNITPEKTNENAREITNVFNSGFDIVAFDRRSAGIKGSPMLLTYWVPGEVLLTGNQKSSQVPVKYDLYRQQLRVCRTPGDSIIVPVGRLQEFSLMTMNSSGSPQPRRFVRYEAPALPPELNGTCAEVLTNGQNVQLVKFWRKIVVKQPENSTNMALSSSSLAFEEKPKLYLRWAGSGKFVPVRTKRNSITNALADQTTALATLKAQKSISTEAELSAAVLAVDPFVTSTKP